jgi:hypothetical protein
MLKNGAIAALAALSMVVAVGSLLAAEHHIKAALVPAGQSGVTGFVQLTQLPHGGTNLHVVAKGLDPAGVYASFYYESSDCSAPFDLLGVFTANTGGIGAVHDKIDDDLDEVGSVSVRVGPGYGALLACATVH